MVAGPGSRGTLIVIVTALPFLIILTALVLPAIANEDVRRGSCVDAGSDGLCPAPAPAATAVPVDPSEVVAVATTTTTVTTTTPHPQLAASSLGLPPRYAPQLNRIDELLLQELENLDAIITCDDYLEMGSGFGDFVDPVSVSTSLHQERSWAESADKPDKCLTLDETLQICDSYRPHYHEHFVQFPASFLPPVAKTKKKKRRAVFVGGGDGMLLHELLKSKEEDEWELIVGLELDQGVVRDSLRHFFVRPRFELYPRVQWWFGDAARSLLLLPREWYGTFDLVMVDLSGTVMSMTVSEELDILRALALLLNPDRGIFVKNEKYMEELAEIFDHVIQIYLGDVPLLCDQDWVLGSFGVDFLRPADFEDGGTTTLVYRPWEDAARHHHGLIKDYARNDIDASSHCAHDTGDDSDPREDDLKEEGQKFGVSLIINAEQATMVPTKLEETLLEAIRGVGGLRIRAYETFLTKGTQSTTVIILSEGYVVARAWPSLQYCAFDVTFWGRFHLLEKTREAMLNAVKAKEGTSSSYRTVVGGMYGTDTWRDDFARIGPRKADCTRQGEGSKADVDPSGERVEEAKYLSNSQIAIRESLALLPAIQGEEPTAVVFCGVRSESECESFDALFSKVRTVVVWTCPSESSPSHDAKNDPPSENLDLDAGVTLCGMRIDDVLRNMASELGGFRLIAIDPTVPPETAIDVANALTAAPLGSEDSLVSDRGALFVLPRLKHLSAYFLEICRLKLLDDLLRLAVVALKPGIGTAEGDSEKEVLMGYLTLGNPLFLPQLTDVTENISRSTGAGATLVEMRSNPVQFQTNYSPHHYTMHDYDEGPGMKQYSEQMSLGKQSLLQMKFTDSTIITGELLEGRAQDFLRGMKVADTELSSDELGGGIVTYAAFDDGHMVVVWNGRQNIDMNVFTCDETLPHKALFEEHFMKHAVFLHSTTLSLWNEQPRGVGNVVNFARDVTAMPECVDRFMICDQLEELGECGVESEKGWMYANCPLACGRC